MDIKHVVAFLIGVGLTLAGALAHYDFKGDVCSGQPQASAQAPQGN